MAEPVAVRGVERYDDASTDHLYRLAWCGRIHFGLWQHPSDSIATAAARVPAVLADLANLTPDDHVLEIGSGAGRTAIDLARDRGCRVTATNIAGLHAEAAAAAVRASGLDQQVSVDVADATDLPFDNGRFTVHWSQEVMIHIPARRKALREAWRVLSPGGRIVMTEYTVNADRMSAEERALVAERQGSTALWDRDHYLDAMRDAGFDHVRALDWSAHLARHFAALVARIDANRAAFDNACGPDVVTWNRYIWSTATRLAESGRFGWFVFIGSRD